ncbi:MAG: helix-hairpin-helix domain-containing protein [Lonepinella koalarum]|nr:helix-hairpin-helix domain-containing protein [Lonepinella koalarum]
MRKLKIGLTALLFGLGCQTMVFADNNNTTEIKPTQTEHLQNVVVAEKLNINTSNVEQIQKGLIGIGAKKAEAIIQYREKHGNFTAIEQLLEVQGIGKATLEKNKDRISL